MADFVGTSLALTQAGFDAATAAVRTSAPEIWSVISVETSGCGFLADRRPQILFERHIFSRLTGGQFDSADPDVSQPTSGGYGQGGAYQYQRLAAAMALDRASALQSASWGLPQILGQNSAKSGFQSVEDMVNQFTNSEDNQLAGLSAFLVSTGLDAALRSHDWQTFARVYNGPNYAANNYDGLLQNFYSRYSSGALPDLQTRAVQVYLRYKGNSSLAVDGVIGDQTAGAIRSFQQSAGMTVTGQVDPDLLQALTPAE